MNRLFISVEGIDGAGKSSHIDAMAAAVRAARPDAREGDLFNPRVEPVIRLRIARALETRGLTPAAVRAAELAEADPAGVTLKVNGAFPWAIGTAMVPCILEALPPRVVARHEHAVTIRFAPHVDVPATQDIEGLAALQRGEVAAHALHE